FMAGEDAQTELTIPQQTTPDLDHISVVQFMLFSAITTAPNFLWQSWMEEQWPTMKQKQEKDDKEKSCRQQLSVGHVVVKFLLDQSLGSMVNTMLYFCVMGLIKGQSWHLILEDIQRNFWSLILAGYRLWPFVCLLNLLLIPLRYRSLVGSLAGLGWGVFLSLR
ncbi:unnamed protein product, partial [Aureobasidium uvarum]